MLYKSEEDIKNINELIVDILSQTEKKNTLLKPYQIDYIERKYFTTMFFDFFDIEYSVLKYLRNEVENCNSFKIDFNMFILYVIVPFVVLYSTFYSHFEISNTFHITSLILFVIIYLTVMTLIFHKSKIIDIIDIIFRKLYRYGCLFYIKSDIHLLNVEKTIKNLIFSLTVLTNKII